MVKLLVKVYQNDYLVGVIDAEKSPEEAAVILETAYLFTGEAKEYLSSKQSIKGEKNEMS